MRCLVTGVAGFVGSSIADRLLADGHSVVGIDCFVDYYPRELKQRNLAQARENSRFSLIEDNLLTTDLSRLLDGCELVYHQAAQAGVRASWGSYFESYTGNNVLATQRLLDAATRIKGIKKIVYASSSSVYGNAEQFPTSEKLVPHPVSPYGVTKLAAEHLMSLYSSEFGVPTVSLRYFTVYGPRQRPDMAFHKFIKAALRGQELCMFGDGEQSRDFTFIDDIVEANIRAAESGRSGSVFNVGGGSVTTMNQVVELLSSIVGEVTVRREERQRGDARHTSADTSALKNALNFAPRVSLAEGIRREVAWMEQLLASGWAG